MKKFLLKTALFLLPVIAAVIAYIVIDPFMAIGHYDNYYGQRDFPVWINHNMASVRTLNNSPVLFDSFIIGDSRAVNFRVKDWEEYLPEGSQAYHLDAYNDYLSTIVSKLHYLESKGYSIKHVLFPFNYFNINKKGDPQGYRFINTPETDHRYLKFHLEHLRAFLDQRFFDKYVMWRLTGDSVRVINTPWYYEWRDMTYDPAVNELTESLLERKLKEGTLYTPAEADSLEKIRQAPPEIKPPGIDLDEEDQLREMLKIFQRHGTDYRIVIIPFRNGELMNDRDIEKLKAVFGADNVVRVDTLPYKVTSFYDFAHLTNATTRQILTHVYGR